MQELQKKLTLTGLTMIAVGCCIGSGVFLVANQIAIALPHPSYILIVWLLGGMIALTGALESVRCLSRIIDVFVAKLSPLAFS